VDLEVLRYRYEVYRAAEEFHRMQQVYLDAGSHPRPEKEQRDAAQACLFSADAYEAALTALYDHLAIVAPFEGREEQMERTQRTIVLLREEKEAYASPV
jgi:hypothetical protein